MSKIYSAAVIGCGSIGALKPGDIDLPGGTNILTHSHALWRHERIDLVAVCDIDPEKTTQAMNKWECDARANINNLFYAFNPDIVVIATPTETHAKILMEVIGHSPKLIIAEKPFGLNFEQAVKMVNIYSEIPIAIDYIRRYANGYKDIKKQIDTGIFGKALNCRVLYTRGLFHEGCHGLDLMHWFFGNIIDQYVEVRDIGVGKERYIVDLNDDDPTVYANFEFVGCPNVVFHPCDGRCYGIFEVDICFEKGRLRFIDNGLYVEKYPINEENEWGHKSLGYGLTSVIRTETGLNTALYNLVDNAVNFLDEKEPLICTAEDALAVHRILEDIT